MCVSINTVHWANEEGFLMDAALSSFSSGHTAPTFTEGKYGEQLPKHRQTHTGLRGARHRASGHQGCSHLSPKHTHPRESQDSGPTFPFLRTPTLVVMYKFK